MHAMHAMHAMRGGAAEGGLALPGSTTSQRQDEEAEGVDDVGADARVVERQQEAPLPVAVLEPHVGGWLRGVGSGSGGAVAVCAGGGHRRL